eukprot:TRINITY_DN9621_c0_g1_i2.p1 TRINITY_DN9621_c0_g1~~TRINITY_DN9621_c0_g1_i2.p1  ORF type:complete len:192 (-),score=8.98 TRINITY_DN9621_c0_g1_i2:179-754(-)
MGRAARKNYSLVSSACPYNTNSAACLSIAGVVQRRTAQLDHRATTHVAASRCSDGGPVTSETPGSDHKRHCRDEWFSSSEMLHHQNHAVLAHRVAHPMPGAWRERAIKHDFDCPIWLDLDFFVVPAGLHLRGLSKPTSKLLLCEFDPLPVPMGFQEGDLNRFSHTSKHAGDIVGIDRSVVLVQNSHGCGRV